MTEDRQRLFFALLPTPAARAALARVAADLRAAHVLRGRWLDPGKYHVTLPFLGAFDAVPETTLAAARMAADTVRAAPFRLALDRLDSFERRRHAPCVLHAAGACEPDLQALFAAIVAQLALQNVPMETGRPYVPHLTLAYGELQAPCVLQAPIEWEVREFVLRLSAHGQHQTIATWPL